MSRDTTELQAAAADELAAQLPRRPGTGVEEGQHMLSTGTQLARCRRWQPRRSSMELLGASPWRRGKLHPTPHPIKRLLGLRC